MREDDPYRFLPTLGEMDLHLLGEGRHEQLWQVLGAHVRRYDGPLGAVDRYLVRGLGARTPEAYASSATSTTGTAAPTRCGPSGPRASGSCSCPASATAPGTSSRCTASDGVHRLKADPMAQATETPPATASRVFSSAYAWGDGDWMDRRAAANPHHGPMSTYEVHLGSWRPGLSYLAAGRRARRLRLRPRLHPHRAAAGGRAPVPAVVGLPGHRLLRADRPASGPPTTSGYLVDRLHQAGIGVILDWVPGHFPKDSWALARFDGSALYEHPDPRRGEQPDWGTYVFDFGRKEVRNFLVANAAYWIEEFHIDGLRVDAVASMLYLDYSRKDGEWEPNVYGGRENLEAVSFLQEANATVYKRVGGVVTIAEESTAWPGVTRPTHLGGLGFGFKWNMGWMHDSLAYLSHEPIHRQWHHHEMTFALMYAWSEQYVLPLSHDEVVHGKGSLLRKVPGDRWQQLATLRAYLAFMWAHPGKQLIFMGGEIAQEAEWSEGRGLDWWLLDHADHRGVHGCVKDLNRVYKETPALWALDLEPRGFEWIDANDAAGNTLSFLRWDDQGGALACISNFSAMPHESYRLGPALGGSVGRGPQHRRRRLLRRRGRQLRRPSRRPRTRGTAARPRRRSASRRSARSGCARRLAEPLHRRVRGNGAVLALERPVSASTGAVLDGGGGFLLVGACFRRGWVRRSSGFLPPRVDP